MKDLNKLSDNELMRMLKEDDVYAYRQIFRRYYAMVETFVSKMLRDSDLAADVTQNVFMKLWIKRSSGGEIPSLKNWLFLVAKNEVLDIFKSSLRKTSSACDADEVETPEIRTPEEVCQGSELNASLSSAVSSMPDKRRMIFRMSRMGHLSNEEIARRLDISVRTVEKHIELALKDIRRTLN
ncbi:MAG: RNA polymerase sigma factor [Candidatus Cryptobacteroides sp.]|nr:RNA polymerase sigma-70 factor [Bacteroidales bacterium]